MTTEKQTVDINFLGRTYRISCEQHECTALRRSAEYLEKRMQEIRNNGKVVGVERIAIMAALNVVNELLANQDELSNYQRSIDEELIVLQQRVDSALSA